MLSEQRQEKYLLMRMCMDGDFQGVKTRVAAGARYHIIEDTMLSTSIIHNQAQIAEYLLSQGASVLRCLPNFLHWQLYNFYEQTNYGDHPELLQIMAEDDFIKHASFVRKYGYPINIRLEPSHLAANFSVGSYYLGKTELDLAIIFGHYPAIDYLRKTGGKRSNELAQIAGAFDFLDDKSDRVLLRALILYEQENKAGALQFIRSLTDIPLTKLIVASLLNNYLDMQEILMRITPKEVESYMQILGKHG